jgi:hypothetical protein
MKDLADVALAWSEEKFLDFITSANTIIEVGSPSGNPHVAGITLYLEVDEADDLDDDEKESKAGNEDDYSPTFTWVVSTDEESAGFGESTLAFGEAPDVERAKAYCWAAVIDYLRDDGYSDEEIANSD